MEEEETSDFKLKKEVALDFKLRVLQENSKMFFEGYKRLEYQAYINITLATFLFAIVISAINKVEYMQKKITVGIIFLIAILFVITMLVLIFSLLTLRKFGLTDFINYKFINLINFNDPLLLKENLLNEMGEKYEGFIEIYTKKSKYLNYGTMVLFIELGMLLGMMITSLYFLLKTT